MSRSILKSISQIGIFTLLSRCIAFLREMLLIRFFGIGAISDAFFAAFRVPNTLRKIVAEGALSSVLVPAFVESHHKRKESGVNKLTTLSFFIIEPLILLFCIFVFFKTESVLRFIAPGFTIEQIMHASVYLKILVSIILFVSSGAIFAATLQAEHRFFIPAVAPSILNVLYVLALGSCIYFDLSKDIFCYCTIGTSVIYFCLNFFTALKYRFRFELPDKQTMKEFSKVLLQFLPCFLSMSVLEINYIIDGQFASFLPSGSLSLIRYAFRFIGIPLGIIATSLSTVLLPHFSKVSMKDPKSLDDHLTEAIKFILWATIPVCFLMGFFSKEIFMTLFMNESTAMSKIIIAQSIFNAYLAGLLFFSINKIFLSIFYALRLTQVPMVATIMAVIVNCALNKLLVSWYQATGIAMASTIASVVQTVFFLLFLHIHLKLPFNWKEYASFAYRYFTQLLLYCSCFWFLYRVIYFSIQQLHFTWNIYIMNINETFFIENIGVWLWAGPLSLLFLWVIYKTRKSFNISLKYFD